MKSIAKAATTVALACLLAGNAWADPHWHHRPRTSVEFGFYWGGPWWYPPYPYPIYAAPPVVVVPPPAPPPVYIEQPKSAPPPEPG